MAQKAYEFPRLDNADMGIFKFDICDIITVNDS